MLFFAILYLLVRVLFIKNDNVNAGDVIMDTVKKIWLQKEKERHDER